MTARGCRGFRPPDFIPSGDTCDPANGGQLKTGMRTLLREEQCGNVELLRADAGMAVFLLQAFKIPWFGDRVPNQIEDGGNSTSSLVHDGWWKFRNPDRSN